MDRSKWEYKKLGEVAQYPKNRLESEFLDVGNYVGVENLLKDKAGRIDAISLPANTSTIEYMENDILIGNIRPYLKKIWLADRHGGASGDVVNIRVKENYRDRICPNFLYCVLSTDAFFDFDMAHSKGAKMPRGNKDEIVKYSIPIPPIADQQRIVAELDCLNEMIALKQEQLKEFDKLAQSIFYDMFGDPSHNDKDWDIKLLKDISKDKLSYGSGASAVAYDGQLRYIRITDIDDFGELKDDVVSPSVFDEKYLLNDGDILFARSGATVGKTYCHNYKYGNCIYAGYLIRLIPNRDIVLPSYVFGYTKTPYYRSFVEGAQRAVAQPNINAKQYGDLKICVPPLALQQQFAEKIQAIEAQKELVKKSIAETQQLLDSRMDYYFD